jgi:integrase/recombinase XerD
MQPLKEPRDVLPTFTEAQIQKLIAWKPQGHCQRRLHLLILLLMDTGCRVSEALNVRIEDIDLDNLLVTLNEKGRKQRIVPFSREMRKALFRYCQTTLEHLLFASRTGMGLNRHNISRDVRLLCHKLGFAPPARTVHAFRHTFALNYLRRGGSVFHLQKMLGHSTLEMTRRYASLQTEDLQAVHQKVSLLVPWLKKINPS